MKAMTLRLPAEMHERLRREAFEQRVSITSLILTALAESPLVELTIAEQLNAVDLADRRAAYPMKPYGITDAKWIRALREEGYEIVRNPALTGKPGEGSE